MKICLLGIALLFMFAGCSTKTQNYRLRMLAAQQIGTINKQRAVIESLRAQLKAKRLRSLRRRQQQRRIHASAVNLPTPPKKNIQLKKVEDTNYSSSYMYPSARRKVSIPKTKMPSTNNDTANMPVTNTQGGEMTKLECISMIGQEKFDKYTQMFGSETASIKRCKMLKSMKN